MNNTLYPIKFIPRFKQKIWGGNKLKSVLNKDTDIENIGESWEISALQGDLSEIGNGFLKGNNIQEITEVYMGDLVGEKIFNTYGIEFPLLIKFIDASDDLSIQVHPDDSLAMQRHNAYGKTEMWYVIDANEGSQLVSGFNKEISKDEYLTHLNNATLPEILNYEPVKSGDVFFIPAGRVHAIGKGILLAEIQQTSDVTYRIYDYNRTDSEGNTRELHTELALDAIDFSYIEDYKTDYTVNKNESSNIVSCNYFTTNMIDFDKKITKEYNLIDSFVIYMVMDGSFDIYYDKEQYVTAEKGETVLLPAIMENVSLIPHTSSKILEVYIE